MGQTRTAAAAIRRPSRQPPSQRARELVDELGIGHPAELDIELIAAWAQVFVKYRALQNHEGHLLRAGARGIIVVDEATRSSHKWRFVIAHELGHFFLHERLDQFEICTEADMRMGYAMSRREAEANEFAAELLMPRKLFEPACEQIDHPDMHAIRKLASHFDTSLTATALQYLAYCPHPAAVVYINTRGVIEWYSASRQFALRLRPGSKLEPTCHAYDLFQGYHLPDEPLPVDSMAWSRTLRGRSLSVYEHAFMLGSFGAALVMLSHD